MEIVLKYVGDGAWLGGVPNVDLTQAQIDASGYTRDRLIASGLYVAAATPAETAPATEPVKAERSARSKPHVE